MKVVITEKSKRFICKLLNHVAKLKEHNTRKISQFFSIQEVRRIVDNPLNKAAAIRMYWSENAKLFQCWQEKSAYYYNIQVSVNMVTGTTICVRSLSDNTNHRKTAVWVSLKSMIDVINLDVDKLEQ